jgi:hypothetical protein
MATQFLYEIIYMKLCGDALGFKRVEALVSIFKTSASSDELHSVEQGYGRWVKQLTFRTESLSVAYVAAVVGHCPNLRTLIIDNTPKWKEAKIHSILLPSIPASLRRMEIHGIWSGNTTENFGAVLRKCPSIRAATLVCMERNFFGDGPNRLPPLKLTDLTLLSSPGVKHLDALRRWTPKLPYLTHLTLDCTVPSPELVSLIQHLGSQLLFLDVRLSWGATDNHFILLCDDISTSCPHLRGFVLHIEGALLPNLCFHSLTHLVIPNHPNRHFSTNAKLRNILDLDLPALTCVRILAGQDLQQFFSSADWVGAYRERGIRIEDEDGMDLLHHHL